MPRPAADLRAKGFTLIELMVTLVILAIIVAIGYPSYRARVMESRRSDGQVLLEKAAADQERFYTLYNTYTTVATGASTCSGSACGLDYPTTDSPEGYYTLSIAPITGKTISTTFELTATPTSKGSQDQDSCKNLTLDSTGKRGFSGTGTLSTCW